jgi:hypothetical protein
MRLVDGLAEAQVARVDLGGLGGGRVSAPACSRGGSQGGVREEARGMETERHLKAGDFAVSSQWGLFICGRPDPRLGATQIKSVVPQIFQTSHPQSTNHLPNDLQSTQFSPSMSLGPSLTQQEWREFRGVISLGLVVTMPVLMALPPRRLNAVALLQLAMLGWGANEQAEYRTGRDLVSWATGRRKVGAAPAADKTAGKAPAAVPLEDKAAADAATKRSRGREG